MTIQIDHLHKSYGSGAEAHEVLHDINLTIDSGEVFGILGSSGAGKSTLVRCINLLERPTSGKVRVDGEDITDAKGKELADVRAGIGMIFQNFSLFQQRTVLRNVTFPLELNHTPKNKREERARYLLDLVGLADLADRYPSQLSGGQQQRIAIARSLLLKPSMLLLDEPFSALDAKIRQQMREELKKIQSDLGITVVFVTHDQEEAMTLSHRIVVMNKGKFEQVGSPTEIYDNPNSKYVASFIGEMNFIKDGDKTIAVRPENVNVVVGGSGMVNGKVRTIMVLGHYVSVNVQCGDDVIKCFVNREISDQLEVGDPVGLNFEKYHTFTE